MSIFFKELRRLGYIEGKNLVALRFSAEGDTARYDPIISDVVSASPDVIFTAGNPLVLRFKALVPPSGVPCLFNITLFPPACKILRQTPKSFLIWINAQPSCSAQFVEGALLWLPGPPVSASAICIVGSATLIIVNVVRSGRWRTRADCLDR